MTCDMARMDLVTSACSQHLWQYGQEGSWQPPPAGLLMYLRVPADLQGLSLSDSKLQWHPVDATAVACFS